MLLTYNLKNKTVNSVDSAPIHSWRLFDQDTEWTNAILSSKLQKKLTKNLPDNLFNSIFFFRFKNKLLCGMNLESTCYSNGFFLGEPIAFIDNKLHWGEPYRIGVSEFGIKSRDITSLNGYKFEEILFKLGINIKLVNDLMKFGYHASMRFLKDLCIFKGERDVDVHFD